MDYDDAHVLLRYNPAGVVLRQVGNDDILNQLAQFASKLTHYVELAQQQRGTRGGGGNNGGSATRSDNNSPATTNNDGNSDNNFTTNNHHPQVEIKREEHEEKEEEKVRPSVMARSESAISSEAEEISHKHDAEIQQEPNTTIIKIKTEEENEPQPSVVTSGIHSMEEEEEEEEGEIPEDITNGENDREKQQGAGEAGSNLTNTTACPSSHPHPEVKQEGEEMQPDVVMSISRPSEVLGTEEQGADVCRSSQPEPNPENPAEQGITIKTEEIGASTSDCASMEEEGSAQCTMSTEENAKLPLEEGEVEEETLGTEMEQRIPKRTLSRNDKEPALKRQCLEEEEDRNRRGSFRLKEEGRDEYDLGATGSLAPSSTSEMEQAAAKDNPLPTPRGHDDDEANPKRRCEEEGNDEHGSQSCTTTTTTTTITNTTSSPVQSPPVGYDGSINQSILKRSVGLARKKLQKHWKELGLTGKFKGVGMLSGNKSFTFTPQRVDLPYSGYQKLQWWLEVSERTQQRKFAHRLAPDHHFASSPIFWAENALVYYVGHFRQSSFEEIGEVQFIKKTARNALLEFEFVKFNQDLADKMAQIATIDG